MADPFDDEAPPPPDDMPADTHGCPVGFLGQRDGDFHFFDHLGQSRTLTPRQLSQGPELLALFGARGSDWLTERFPAHDREGKPTGIFSPRRVNKWLVAETERAGLFDPNQPERRIGLWRADDVLVLHLGDRILWGEQWRRPGFREAGALWPARPPAFAPAAAPATPRDCQDLEALFGRWRWGNPLSEMVMLGLWAAGMMGAAISWRPHGFVVGEAGSGKSTLFELLAIANPMATLVNDYSEAGLRQTLSGHASAALLDEADADDQVAADKLNRVIGMLRRASGHGGARALRGSAGGEAQRFDVVASALMGAILPPVLLPQDASRITRLDLLPFAAGGPPLPTEAERKRVRGLGPAFLARAVAVLPRFAAAFAEARAQVLALDGGAPRVADQIGAILAARWIMVSDDPLPPLGEEIAELAWAIPSAEARQAEGGPVQCLQHLFGSALDGHRSGDRLTVARTIGRAWDVEGSDGQDARRLLLDHGMRLGRYPLSDAQAPPGLYVMNSHPQLVRMFAQTRWAGGKWREDLARLPAGERPDSPVKLAPGQKVRCVWVHADHLPRQGTAGDDS